MVGKQTSRRKFSNWMRVASLLWLAMSPLVVVSGCKHAEEKQASAPSAYDRVIKSGTIRAAYLDYPPAFRKDAKTGKASGIFVDTLEQVASNLGLKVEWTEEVGWGSQIEGLNADRYDIVGSPVWANPTRGKLTTLSAPVYYSGIGVYVRTNDHRFDSDLSAINSNSVHIATIDGETGDLIARTQFPAAKRVSFPQLTDISQLFLEVGQNKADVFFAEPYFAYLYSKNNSMTLKNITADRPIRVLGNCYMFKKNEFQFKQMIDTALQDLQNSGYIDQLLSKYEGGNTYYPVAPLYRKPK